MIKRLAISTACAIVFASVSGQNLVEKISDQICDCIDTIQNMDSLQAKIDRCAPESIDLIWGSENDEDEDYSVSDDSINNTMDSVMANLIYYCPKIRNFVLADREAINYKMSVSEKANGFYKAGNEAFESENYVTAEKKYLKAIKADPKFVYAYDNLALAYRSSGKYKKSIKYYDKSLDIYPEGSFALQNQAVAFTYLKDFRFALENYEKLVTLYPENPEGYYGIAKIYVMNEDYEDALDYVFCCHKLYSMQKSDYAKDSEKLISTIFDKLKEQNKLDLFYQKAKEYGIKTDSSTGAVN